MSRAEEGPSSLEVLFTLVKNYLDAQVQHIATLRSRGTAYVGFSLAILAIFAGLSETELAPVEAIAYALVFVSAFLLFCLVLYFTFSMLFEDVLRGPEPGLLVRDYIDRGRAVTLPPVLDAFQEAVDKNEWILSETVRGIDRATVLLVVQAMLVFGTLAYIRVL